MIIVVCVQFINKRPLQCAVRVIEYVLTSFRHSNTISRKTNFRDCPEFAEISFEICSISRFLSLGTPIYLHVCSEFLSSLTYLN